MSAVGEGRGPVQVYEVVWRSGHVERVLAHQVAWPGAGAALFSGMSGKPQQIHFHAEIDGRWMPTLIADEADIIQTVRLVTQDEPLPAGPDV